MRPPTIYLPCADKGQTGSTKSAPGSVLIKEQVAALSMHPGMGQEKKDEADWQMEQRQKLE